MRIRVTDRSLLERRIPLKLVTALLVLFLLALIVNQSRLLSQRVGHYYPALDYPIGLDYAAFHSAGQTIDDGGTSADLYDDLEQTTRQQHILGSELWNGRSFAYPAFVALPLIPLSRLPYLLAFGLATLAELIAIGAAIVLLSRVFPIVRAFPVVTGLICLGFPPLMRGLVTGTTIGLSLLFVTGLYVSLREGKSWSAGIWLGLLCYKPTLALPLVLLLLWKRQWRTVGASAALVSVLSAISAVVVGPRWMLDMLKLIGGSDYQQAEMKNAGHYSISLIGFMHQLLGSSGLIVSLLSVLILLGGAFALRTGWRDIQFSSREFPFQFGFAITMGILLSPHALYYEAALLALPLIALADHWRTADRAIPGNRDLTPQHRWALCGLFTCGFLWPYGVVLGYEPMIVLVIGVAGLMWWSVRRPAAFAAHDDVSRSTAIAGAPVS